MTKSALCTRRCTRQCTSQCTRRCTRWCTRPCIMWCINRCITRWSPGDHPVITRWSPGAPPVAPPGASPGASRPLPCKRSSLKALFTLSAHRCKRLSAVGCSLAEFWIFNEIRNIEKTGSATRKVMKSSDSSRRGLSYDMRHVPPFWVFNEIRREIPFE